MTTDLVTWLRQQLDADERAVIAYRDQHPGQPCVNYEEQDPADYDEYDSCERHIAVFKATPYGHVEFGLLEVDAKRQILDRHDRVLLRKGQGADYYVTAWVCKTCGGLDSVFSDGTLAPGRAARYPCGTLRLLALPYADREGYDERWRP